jgi:1-acyl-sn-glycerol-3-phosphate acyltransferase
LQNGVSLIIFPQGTRKKTFNPSEFNSLGTKLAARTGAKVVPVAIKTDFWGPGRLSSYLGPIARKKHVYIAFGAPVAVSGSGKEEHQEIVDFISRHLEQWKDTPR